MKFIRKEQLEKEYIAFGKFYVLEYDNGETNKCRNLLEIFKREEVCKVQGINKIDAIFIMMNPGRGKPKIGSIQDNTIQQVKIDELDKIQIVEADPDDTQYQVMRVMRQKDWKYVRVINLSDFINTKSKDFYKMIENVLCFDKESIHSIFSKKRKKELEYVFKAEQKFKVITAWGVSTKLSNLINLALKNSHLEGRIGNNKATYKRKKYFYYYHPLPTNKSMQPIWIK